MGLMRWSLALLLATVTAGASAQQACPPGLAAAAARMGETMQEEQEVIRTSSLARPEGVEETVQFDLGAHACHRGPGQAYRVFGEPACQRPDDQGRVPVRYPYRLQYRKALTLDELFRREWQEGSDGVQQVLFEREGDGWIPTGRKEILLQLESNRPAGSGHPGGTR